MELTAFPRPPQDNGRGIHWVASPYHPDGDALRRWVDELRQMNVKWVKLLDDGRGSSLKVCALLLENGIMPVVRIYRYEPNPGHLGTTERETIRRLVALGVRYFETNNEPNLPGEWKGGKRPPNWLEVVVENFIIDADIVLTEGGFPAIPALSPGDISNPYILIAEKRPDLYESGIWAAIHNYTLNHPLDYPDDPVNQQGQPLTQEEYRRLGSWAWDGDSLEEINRWREADKNPGATVMDDLACWRAFEAVNRMIVEVCGHSIPIISTEGGPVVGWRQDRRYPRVTPEIHRDMVVGINDYMQREAPPYYFACCHWLIANFKMGHPDPIWEQHAWYTDAWNDQFGLSGRLPAVDAVKAMPSVVRVERGRSSIAGFLRDEEGRYLGGVEVTLYKDGTPVASVSSDVSGLFRFAHLSPGVYDVAVEGVGTILQGVDLGEEESKMVDVPPVPLGERSALKGRVMDEDGRPRPDVVITLYREDSPVAKTRSDADGAYAFGGLREGLYSLKAERLTVAYLALDGWSEQEFDLVLPRPPGYRYRVITKRLLPPEETFGRRLFYGRVFDPEGVPMSGVRVMMTWTGAPPGTRFPVKVTGSDPSKPPGYYEFTHTPGEFQLHVVQGDWDSEVAEGLNTAHVPGREPGAPVVYEVNFQLQPVGEASGAVVRGEMPGVGEGKRVALTTLEARQVAALDPEGRFRFEGLPAGEYALELVDLGTVAEGIRVDENSIYHLRLPFRGIVEGRLDGAPEGAEVRLVSARFGWHFTAKADAEGRFRFEGVPRGRYLITVQDVTVGEAESDGVSHISLPDLALEERFGSIGGRVTDALRAPVEGVKLTLLKEDGSVVASATTDAEGRYSFPHVRAGVYAIKAEAFGVLKPGVEVGAEPVEVDLTLPPGKPRKPIEFGVLFGPFDNPVAQANFALARDYLLASRATALFSVEEAKQARRVLIIGDENVVGAEDERALTEAGCEVSRIAGDSYAIAQALKELQPR